MNIKRSEKRKINKYFNLLHPDFKYLSEKEKEIALDNKNFIYENFNSIDEYYNGCKTPGSGADHEHLDDSTIISMAVKFRKGQIYFDLLHPEYESLSPEEQRKSLCDKHFIYENIDSIDKYYKSTTLNTDDVNEINEKLIDFLKELKEEPTVENIEPDNEI